MAIKKSELYSSLDRSTNKIRGGMDASLYKNYILTMLFLKYVTDKFLGKKFAAVTVPEDGNFEHIKQFRGKECIGEEIDKAIRRLSEANKELTGLFNDVHFNDDTKFGVGEEKTAKLTDLVNIFCRPEFDLKNNKASGDDILGDTYEYLMRKYAVEGGKSKGQFYTPGEASRVLAGLLGISRISARPEGWSINDPACGSASLLIRAVSEAPCPVAIYGQEMDITTAALAKMNLVLHNRATGEIRTGNTFAAPQFTHIEDGAEVLDLYDFEVVNPPFSLKNWKDGFKDFGRLAGYGAEPPEKNGDYAWLMHVIKTLKPSGRAAIILPLGVLFRGNAEETIRKFIIDKGWIEGIVAFPGNIFYGTGIPACVIVINKTGAASRAGIFMIDASRDFIKDGDKNRLRERDVYKIVKTYTERIEEPHYSRFVQWGEIKKKNGYNLNIPRYIDSGVREDIQDIRGHLEGGMPSADIDSLGKYWGVFPELRSKLFKQVREGYYALKIAEEDVRDTISSDEDFVKFGNDFHGLFLQWVKSIHDELTGITEKTNSKMFIKPLAEELMKQYEHVKLVDRYDVYEALLSFWVETMSDDVFAISHDGFEAGRELMDITKDSKNKKTGKVETKIVGWDGKIIPREVLDRVYFGAETKAVADAGNAVEAATAAFAEFVEEESAEGGCLFDYITREGEEDKLDTKKLKADYTKLKKAKPKDEDTMRLARYFELEAAKKSASKLQKAAMALLEKLEKEKYPVLSLDELKKLIVDEKWIATVRERVDALYSVVVSNLAERVVALHDRYAETLPELDAEGEKLEAEFAANLREMGY